MSDSLGLLLLFILVCLGLDNPLALLFACIASWWKDLWDNASVELPPPGRQE